ncbi:MAG: glycosyltransferase family 39 protein [Bryobacterales bacterium]|nr:glycosyltransferase family 39 protein [Bryobacterales bacterium]
MGLDTIDKQSGKPSYMSHASQPPLAFSLVTVRLRTLFQQMDAGAASLERLASRLWLPALLAALALIAYPILLDARFRSIRNDEFFTWHVVHQNSFTGILNALLRGADNHPPLDYFTRLVSIRIAGDTLLGFRLPSVIGFLVACLSLFALIRPVAGTLAAFVALLLPVSTFPYTLAAEGRSYAISLGCAGLALLCWRAAAEGRYRPLALAGLWISLAAAVSLHYYGVFLLLPVAAAEAVHIAQRRRLDKAILAALLLSAAALVALLPFILFSRRYASTFWSPVNANAVLLALFQLFQYASWPVLLILLIWIAGRWPSSAEWLHKPEAPLWAASLALLANWCAVYIAAATVTHAFSVRYIGASVLGCALITALHLRHRPFLAALLLALLAKNALYYLRHGETAPVTPVIRPKNWQSQQPLVFGSSHDFAMQVFHAPAGDQTRLVYLIDPAASRQIIGHDTADVGLSNLSRAVPLHLEPYERFLREHPRFTLISGSDPQIDWVSRRIVAEKAHLVLREVVSGRLVWDVDLTPAAPR